MTPISFGSGSQFDIAILIKKSSFRREDIEYYYVNDLKDKGIDPSKIMALDLDYGANNKITATNAKAYLASIAGMLKTMGIKYILCADSTYYKTLTKQKKAETNLDNIVDAEFPGFEDIKVAYTLNYSSLVYNPNQQEKIDISLTALANHTGGNFRKIGLEFKEERYPLSNTAIKKELQSLHQFPELAVDIEAFSLRLGEAGIATISFAEDIDSGCSFPVDYHAIQEQEGLFGIRKDNVKVRSLLREFFEEYKGSLTAHNCSYDFKQLVWELWMEHPLDMKGAIKGIKVLTRAFNDTKIIAYCCLNSTSRPSLGLKDLGYPYAGDYGEENIKDIRKIPLHDLLKYNLTDACTTLWVQDRYVPDLIKDQQVEIYEQLLKMQRVLLLAELHGMPMNEERLNEVDKILNDMADNYYDTFMNSEYIVETEHRLRKKAMNKRNLELKVKRVSIEDFDDLEFNPNSDTQMRVLLYEVLELPTLKMTKNKNAKVDGDTITALMNHTTDPVVKEVLQAIKDYLGVLKIIGTFIKAFKRGILKADGMRYVHGSFNIGGTVSGRLSSSDPNLQNLPAGSEHGKLVKSIFQAPEGKLWVYCDFNSLEDYISALLSKDPNKMKVYLDGYDGHCLRAFSYFPDRLPGIVNTLESINSIKKLFPVVRQDSKIPTFTLTYGGTWKAIMDQCGLPKSVSMQIETNYHGLYKVSDDYTAERITEAAHLGYMTLAFGLRLRCPLLKQTIRNSNYSVRGTSENERTLGNAIGQSYGLLNNRAMIDFLDRVWDSPYIYDIIPIAPIHDASYYIITDDVNVVKFTNDHLVDAMQWQEDPAIAHDTVKIGGELDIAYPSWADAFTIPNYATKETILRLATNHIDEMTKEAA